MSAIAASKRALVAAVASSISEVMKPRRFHIAPPTTSRSVRTNPAMVATLLVRTIALPALMAPC